MSEKKNLDRALKEVDMASDDLAKIAHDFVSEKSGEVDKIISQVESVKDLSDERIQNLLILLSLKAYSLSESREYASMKADIATAIRKEKHAEVFAMTDGTVGAKENAAVSGTTEEILVSTIHNLVASLLRAKLDAVYRLVDSLKSVLTSRASERKLTMLSNSQRSAYD